MISEAIDNLIDAAESGNSLVLERAIAKARAAQEAHRAEADEADAAEAEVNAPDTDVETEGVVAPGTPDEAPGA